MSVFSNLASSTPEEVDGYVAAILGLLGDRDPVAVMEETPGRLKRLVSGVPAPLLARREAPGKWSMVMVVQHLGDSELVGGFRLRMILAHDRPPVAGYDQDRFAERLHYEEVPVAAALAQFSALRRANLRLWRGLTPAELARTGVHSERGEESLERMRKLYAGHDLLHLRQLERIRGAVGTGRTGRTGRPSRG